MPSNALNDMKVIVRFFGAIFLTICVPAALCQRSVSAAPPISFAGVWKGKLRTESQDSYRGNNAKGAHRVTTAVWLFEISPDEKAITVYPAQWKGPKKFWRLTHKDNHTITWHESTKASTGAPTIFYDKNGRPIGN